MGVTCQIKTALQLRNHTLSLSVKHSTAKYLLVLVIGAEVVAVLEVEELDHGPLVRQVLAEQRDEEMVLPNKVLGRVLRGIAHLLGLALETLEDDVEDAVGVEVEVADEGLDHLDHVGGADLERELWSKKESSPYRAQVLVQLRDQLGVTLGLLTEQVELLLLVAGGGQDELSDEGSSNPYNSFVFSLI